MYSMPRLLHGAQGKGIIKDNGDHKFSGDDHIFSRGELARYMYYAYK